MNKKEWAVIYGNALSVVDRKIMGRALYWEVDNPMHLFPFFGSKKM